MRAEVLKHLIVFMISDLYSGIGHSWVGRKTRLFIEFVDVNFDII